MKAPVFKVLTANAISREDQAQQSAVREQGLSRLLMAYISAGLAFLVLPGTLIGVWNLISISSAHFEGAARVGWVQAHGHAQLFGWVGSFILGIGYYSIPKSGRLTWFPLSKGWLCWMLWTTGVLMRWIIGFWSWNWRLLLPISAAMELCALLIFIQSVTRYRAVEQHRKFEIWILSVMSGTAGLLLTLTLNLLESARLARAGISPVFPHTFDQKFLVVATWGFLVPVIWGFSSRWMPVFLGLQRQRKSIFVGALAINASGVVSALMGWFLSSTFCMTGGTAASIIALRLWEPTAQPPKIRGIHSSFTIFIRLAFGWLLMAAFLALWAALNRGPGIWGASRHALTVGFIATMIFSVGPRVLPAFSGMKPLFSTRLMFAALAMLTSGCALRVPSEILAYQRYIPWGWKLLPASAIIELTAVLIFALNMGLTFVQPPIVPLRGN